ncbi:MAG TPA: hemerythrin domain-containing protein [Chromatiaceae bacterium]|nr:hemerythrin domain-containing protein [Chromatiaceae bacterium]
MIPLETLKKQHEEICDLIHVLSLLVEDERARKSRSFESLFSELLEMVSEHLILEDDTLYKDLLIHQDPEVQRTARNFLSGSHELKRVFSEYLQYACHSGSKPEECEAFVKETKDVFRILQERIRMEESKFYPIAGKT